MIKRSGLAILAVLCAAPAYAQSADDSVRFKITAGGKDLYKLAIPAPLGDRGESKSAQDVLSNDLALAGYFKVLDPAASLANVQAEQLTINPPDWVNVGAEGVIKARATAYGSDVKFEFRLYEVAKGDTPVLSKDYRGPMTAARQLAHQFAGEVVRYYTNEDSFFASQVTFAGDVGLRRRDIFIADWDGFGAHAITHTSQNILPTWSRDGGEIAFTTFAQGKPDLVALPTSGAGKPRTISSRQGVNTGAAWSPDGSKIAASLSFEGNAQIYLLSSQGQIIKRLTTTSRPFIDTSPTWSPDGSKIAFVSDRFGSPQIWTMSADGSGQQRLTRRGTYNQEPSWCPRKDASLVAFTARDEKYAYDIFTINTDTNELVRITEGHGSNHHPSWAPNGRAIVYQSSRGGLWISTADGRTERQVYRGSVEAPQWGPLRK